MGRSNLRASRSLRYLTVSSHVTAINKLIYLSCRELLQTRTAADFYTAMAQLGERLRRAQMLPSPEFMQVGMAT